MKMKLKNWLKMTKKKKDMGQPELIHQNCDLSHETEIISHKENWNRSQRLILNQPSVEW
jgi:hypothetical protein